MRETMGVFVLWTLCAAAQHVGQNEGPGSSAIATFTSTAQLVVETVVVTDKNGASNAGWNVQGIEAQL